MVIASWLHEGLHALAIANKKQLRIATVYYLSKWPVVIINAIIQGSIVSLAVITDGKPREYATY